MSTTKQSQLWELHAAWIKATNGMWQPIAAESEPVTCPTTWRMKQIEETGGEIHPGQRRFGGELGTYAQGYVEFRQDYHNGVVVDATHAVIEAKQHHEFPNTGCNRSWCSRCGVVGNWNWRESRFE